MDSEKRLEVAKLCMATAEHAIDTIDEPAGVCVVVFNSKGEQTILTSLESTFQLVKLLHKALERAVAIEMLADEVDRELEGNAESN